MNKESIKVLKDMIKSYRLNYNYKKIKNITYSDETKNALAVFLTLVLNGGWIFYLYIVNADTPFFYTLKILFFTGSIVIEIAIFLIIMMNISSFLSQLAKFYLKTIHFQFLKLRIKKNQDNNESLKTKMIEHYAEIYKTFDKLGCLNSLSTITNGLTIDRVDLDMSVEDDIKKVLGNIGEINYFNKNVVMPSFNELVDGMNQEKLVIKSENVKFFEKS